MKYALFTLLLIFSACANQTAPTGGPKDKTPPQLISSQPEHRSVNVKTNEIVLEFDEYVKLDKAKEQIIISPNFDSETQYESRKNKVFIKFENNLPDSTTITVNFREAIKDITEGNSPDNLKLAFSTGSYLDSLTMSGTVTDLLTDQPSKDYSVYLYNSNDTLNVFEDSPLYFTKTNKEGLFKFENIKTGSYNIYAVNDKNKNLKIDFNSESYAFYDSSFTLNDSINNIELRPYYFNIDSNKIKSARQNGTIYEVKFLKYITNYNLISIDSNVLYSNFTDKDHKSIQIYNYNLSQDSIQTIIEYTDSTLIQKNDTINLKFTETVRSPKEFTQNIKLEKIFPSDGNLKGTIQFNKPIISINYDSIYLYLDSLNIIPISESYLNSNVLKDEFYINYKIDKIHFESKENTEAYSGTQQRETKEKSINPQPNKNIRPYLYIGRGAFVSVEQDTLNFKQTNLSFAKIDEYGTILLETTSSKTNFTVQLLDKDYKTIMEQPGKNQMTFTKVPPGDYIIRVLIDSDESNQWDIGNIRLNKTPEPIYFYTNDSGKKEITIRANWELGPLLLEF